MSRLLNSVVNFALETFDQKPYNKTLHYIAVNILRFAENNRLLNLNFF